MFSGHSAVQTELVPGKQNDRKGENTNKMRTGQKRERKSEAKRKRENRDNNKEGRQ
jgi:hypothetical protein